MNVVAALLALIVAEGALATGAAPDLVLTPQKPLSRTVDAYPRIKIPSSSETALVNAALEKGDARVKNAARDCGAPDTYVKGQWNRTISVPMRYGNLLSFAVTDEWACPAYQGSYFSTFTYDLTTGAPLDWATVLPPRIAGDPAQASGGDTSKLDLVASPILNEIYRRKVLIALDPETRAACADSFQARYFLLLWLDAENQGVGLHGVGLPPRPAGCDQDALLTLDELGQLKAEPRLIEALKAAHAAHAWSTDITPNGSHPKAATRQ